MYSPQRRLIGPPSPRLLLLSTAALLFGACAGGDTPPPDDDPDGGGPIGPAVEVCSASLAQPSEGFCSVTSGTGTATIYRGDVLGTGTVFENGSVVVENGNITCVGCDCEAQLASATVVDCPGAAISPGLINPHDHIRFTEGAPIAGGLTRYNHRHDWRGSVSTPQNPNGTGQNDAGMRWGELRMLFSGVTSLVGSGRAQNLIRNLDDPVDAELALGFSEVEFQTFSLGDSNESFHADCDWNYRYDEIEASEFSAFLPHVAEGINSYAAEEFRCQSTSFGGGEDFTESNASHIHSIGLGAVDYQKMVADGTRLLWSPRSNISLYGHTAQVGLFDTLGGTIALGTDWTYTGSANMVRELSCASDFNRDYLDGHFNDEQLWKMATVNAAIATGTDSLIGSLEPGKLADIAIYGTRSGAVHHRAVIDSENQDVALVLLAGRPIHGEAATVSALGESCDPVDVCGTAMSVCASREFGATYAAIAAEVSGSYPAVFCGPPAGEPTCVPLRQGEFTGEITADDSDGDGLANVADNCPNVFNAPRPIDNGAQPDSDGDGIGDPCDDTPLAVDIDSDGIDNSADNCPFDANADQLDGDADNRGDACDFCPAEPNPNTVCFGGGGEVTTVNAVQTGAVAEGTVVNINDLVVTAVWANGAWAQDPTGGDTHSGVQIFTGPNPGVQIGDLINVTGEVVEFFEDTELTDATISNVRAGQGATITPAAVTAAVAATEPYEGVLVTITDVNPTEVPYDCANDNASCTDPNTWRINSSVVVFDRAYQDADWAAQQGSTSVTGVMSYRFDARRILPRTTADF